MENHSSPITRIKDLIWLSKLFSCNSLTSGVSSLPKKCSKHWLVLTNNPMPSKATMSNPFKNKHFASAYFSWGGGWWCVFCFVCFVLGFFIFVTVCCFQHHLRGWNVSFLPLTVVSFSTWQMLTTTPAAPRPAAATGAAFLFSLSVICVISRIYSPGMWLLNQYAFSFPKECLILQPQLCKNTLILTNEGVVALLRQISEAI